MKEQKGKGKKELFQQLVRFGFVGVSAFIIDYGIMILLTEVFHINYLVSSGISFSVSVIYNYILSIFWVFNVDKQKSGIANFAVFMVLSIIGLGINQLVMWILVDKAQIFYMLSKIVATIVVSVYNFITRKIFLEE
ncbi:GtrA family protein [Blautia liquoris]|uniref:GtrA family protein n=1 Tax=Blautia liquoris TaxID=2779518 RepID=A0A7M2RHU0_9FIRM|nr:GtrA family protein [Blautia liquoris]QOV19591.1 GtrA family protein [Blautia liquoris]